MTRQKKYYNKNRIKVIETVKIYYNKNKPKIRIYQQIYKKMNADKIKIKKKIYRKKNKDKIKNNNLKWWYGITLAIYNQMFKKQHGKCAICKRQTKLVVDHDHTTNKVRGLLCNDCNIKLPLLENKKRAKNALKYLGFKLWI
jgi:hypothetical protein